MDQEQVLEISRNYLSFLADHDVDVQRAWVFGSSVKDTFNENSDIDLALTIKDLTNSFLMQMHLMRLSWKFDPRIEPHPFADDEFEASNPFVDEILSTGIRVM
ncbi:MAG TPA: nucleotidyltransferase domain-containing protein [Caldilineae bacterium]|nr:nucleotidyltransferase domain-containing protein [Caldilineae bacterium]